MRVKLLVVIGLCLGCGLAQAGDGSAGSTPPTASLSLHIDRDRAQRLGQRIWHNESNRSVELLTAWNEGEEFASLGIGHFIWYPDEVPQRFQESFPAVLRTFRQHGVALPGWLARQTDPDCPWPNRSAFLADFDSERMRALRDLLTRTIDLQSVHIAQRLTDALPKLLAASPPDSREVVQRRFLALFASDAGLYAMVDYVNFKGEGISTSERYQGEGWGLLQVLLRMSDTDGTRRANAFSNAAALVLLRRIELSPPERGEARWRRGWLHRVATYREEH